MIYARNIKTRKEIDMLQISLAAARVNANLTQRDVAKALGISTQTLVNWEAGKTEPSANQARALASLYGIKLDYIFLPDSSN